MNSEEKYRLQEEYCKRTNSPFFAFRKCFSCGRDIWERISEEEAGSELVTGCPFCCRSFCE